MRDALVASVHSSVIATRRYRTGGLRRKSPAGSVLACDARRSAVRQDAHAIARPKSLIRFLHDRKHLTTVELNGDLNAAFTGKTLLRSLACYTAYDGAPQSTESRSGSVADRTARDSAADRASAGANAGARAFELHFAYAFDVTHANGLLAPRLFT
jgi:hypothetical protein